MQTIVKKMYCDVAVIGGGVSGCSAAITASRRGLHTILLERGVSLGGLATNGYVPQVAGMIEGNCKQFVLRLEADGNLRRRSPADDHNPTFDPEYGKFMLEQMVMEHGGRILYDSTCIDVEMDGNSIKCVVFYTKGGWMAVYAKIFIDGTGDADVSAMAGVPYETGGADFCGLNMSTTLGSRWGNYNRLRYEAANAAWLKQQADAKVGNPNSLFYECEEKAIAAGDLTRHFTMPNNPFGMVQIRIPNTPDDHMEFCTFSFHSYFTNNTDVENISRQVVEQHQQMQMYEKFMRKYIPGYENIHLIGVGSIPGVRDSRRIFGEYMLQAADIVCGTKFEDGIARFPEMLDVHHPTSPKYIFQRHVHIPAPAGTAVCREAQCDQEMHPFVRPAGVEARPDPGDYCDIPYRSLLPQGVNNLLAVGRCCSAEFHANGAMRIIGPAMGTGQAAGAAAYMAISRKALPHDLDGRLVRKFLIEEEGVELNKAPDGWWAKVRAQEGTPVIKSGDFVVIEPTK